MEKQWKKATKKLFHPFSANPSDMLLLIICGVWASIRIGKYMTAQNSSSWKASKPSRTHTKQINVNFGKCGFVNAENYTKTDYNFFFSLPLPFTHSLNQQKSWPKLGNLYQWKWAENDERSCKWFSVFSPKNVTQSSSCSITWPLLGALRACFVNSLDQIQISIWIIWKTTTYTNQQQLAIGYSVHRASRISNFGWKLLL